MGRVFQHVYRDAKTGAWKKTHTWYISYSVHGRPHMESSGSTKRPDAVRLLKRRLGEIGVGQFRGPAPDRTTFEELAQMITADYQVNGRKSLATMQDSFKALRAFLGLARARDITLDRLNAYVVQRQEAGRQTGTIRNELAVLKRAFRLAERAGKAVCPPFPVLRPAPPRAGFLEDAEYEGIVRAIGAPIRPLVGFLYWTGWRVGEARGLQWHQVDFEAGTVRLEPGATKNDEGRLFPFRALPPLATLLEAQRAETTALERAQGRIIPSVFHRDGEPIHDFRGAWEAACVAAGCYESVPVLDAEGRPQMTSAGTPRVVQKPTKLVHDLRRTAVRRLERAGVSRSVAMQLTGHKTESVYRRYAIVAEADLAEGVQKLAVAQEQRAHRARTIVPLAPSARRARQ
jgi:integrase